MDKLLKIIKQTNDKAFSYRMYQYFQPKIVLSEKDSYSIFEVPTYKVKSFRIQDLIDTKWSR